jgi:hypothetical protein
MSKNVHFSDEPDLVRQLSDQSEARKQNSQTPFEQRMASNTFYREEKQKMNTDKNTKEKYENKKKNINTPINKRVSDAVSKGNKEASQIRNEKIAEEHRYDYWWLGGKKMRTKKIRRRKMRTRKMRTRKSIKNKK